MTRKEKYGPVGYAAAAACLVWGVGAAGLVATHYCEQDVNGTVTKLPTYECSYQTDIKDSLMQPVAITMIAVTVLGGVASGYLARKCAIKRGFFKLADPAGTPLMPPSDGQDNLPGQSSA